jgi:hypothetical protein
MNNTSNLTTDLLSKSLSELEENKNTLIEINKKLLQDVIKTSEYWQGYIKSEILSNIIKLNNDCEKIKIFISETSLIVRLTTNYESELIYDITFDNNYRTVKKDDEINLDGINYTIIAKNKENLKTLITYTSLIGLIASNFRDNGLLSQMIIRAWKELTNLRIKESKSLQEALLVSEFVDNHKMCNWIEEMIPHFKAGNSFIFSDNDIIIPTIDDIVSPDFKSQLIDIVELGKTTCKIVVYNIHNSRGNSFNKGNIVTISYSDSFFNDRGKKAYLYTTQRISIKSFLKEFWFDLRNNKNIKLTPISENNREDYKNILNNCSGDFKIAPLDNGFA